MRRAGDAMRAGGVGAVYLVHGTFTGPDASGILTQLGRLFPAARDLLGRVAKSMIDATAREYGNYTPEYAEQLEQSLSRPGARRIPVRLFHWSSENHHIGRADAAVRLIDEIASHEMPEGERVLLWGHSHGGNVLALASNLLAGDREAVGEFFHAARLYYRWPWTGMIDIPVWYRVERLLADRSNGWLRRALDMVTFGTPVRYGWDAAGYARLLHFIFHVPRDGAQPDCAEFPPRLADVVHAVGGDYVQQFAIAGTDTLPSAVAWRALWADRRLHELFEPCTSPADLVARLMYGRRAHDQGTTLLVDYGSPEGPVSQHLAGHAVYAQPEWLVYHTEEIARRFYGLS